MSSPRRAPFSRYRDLLASHGFRPSKKLGQNFLLDPALQRWIAETAGVGPADTVLEVGVGLGFLTRELARRAAAVVAVEIDSRLADIFTAELAGWGEERERVHLVRTDALEAGGWHPRVVCELEAHRGDRLLLVANLPYSAAGPLLAAMPAQRRPPDGGAVMIQDDMARRIAAEPGTPEYGGLSVVVQASYEVRVVRRVGPDVFWPRPGVESAVLSLRRRADGALQARAPGERAEFGRFVRALFGQRRKKLGNVLDRACAEVGRERPPELPAEVADQRPGALSWDKIAEIWAQAPSLP